MRGRGGIKKKGEEKGENKEWMEGSDSESCVVEATEKTGVRRKRGDRRVTGRKAKERKVKGKTGEWIDREG